MKISKNQTLGLLALLGGAVTVLSKSKSAKTVGLCTSIVSGGILLKRMCKEEYKTIKKECKETEEVFENSGINPAQTTKVSLMTGNEETTPIFGNILLTELYKNSVFPDEMLEFDPNFASSTLHIMQNLDKNRVIVSIPLPRNFRKIGGLSPKNIRYHYQKIFEEFVKDYKIDQKVYLNQIGVVVIEGYDEESQSSYTDYFEIIRDEDEKFPEYIDRVYKVMNACENGHQDIISGVDLDEEEKIVRIEHYLNVELQVFPESSDRKGLDLLSAIDLLKRLTDVEYIMSDSRTEIQFSLDRIVFHPSNDYGQILSIKDGKLKIFNL